MKQKQIGLAVTVKGHNKETGVYTASASTLTVDRDGDVLVPKGCLIENFMKNPVLLGIHDYRSPAVGKVIKLTMDDNTVDFDFVFAKTPAGEQFDYLYANDFQRAFSVGFIPKKSMYIEDTTPDDVNVTLPDGKTIQSMKLSQFKSRPKQIITEWELLEISPVPVPANPEALMRGAMDYAVKMLTDKSKALGDFATADLQEHLDGIAQQLKEFVEGTVDYAVKKAIPYKLTPINADAAWDAAKARVEMARWASSDQSGGKDTISWVKYAQGFGWMDAEKADQFTSYKLVHHTIEGGKIVGVKKGIMMAMAQCLAKSDTLDLGPDFDSVYAHLAKHYEDMGMAAPDKAAKYTAEQLKQIEDGTFKVEGATDPANPTPALPVSSELATQLALGFEAALKKLFGELDEVIMVRMSVMTDTVKELTDQVSATLTKLNEIAEKGLPVAADPADPAEPNKGKKMVFDDATMKALNGFVGTQQ